MFGGVRGELFVCLFWLLHFRYSLLERLSSLFPSSVNFLGQYDPLTSMLKSSFSFSRVDRREKKVFILHNLKITNSVKFTVPIFIFQN